MKRSHVPQEQQEPDLQPLNIKVERELKQKLRIAAKLHHRSIQGEVVFFLEQGLSHPARDKRLSSRAA